MVLPTYQEIMLPLLKSVSDERLHAYKDIVEDLSNEFQLTESERQELLLSGYNRVFDNRVGWAATYLKKAGLIVSPKRGWYQITDRGEHVLSKSPIEINNNYLEQYPEFLEFKSTSREPQDKHKQVVEQTPEELLENAYQELKQTLAQELLLKVKSSSPKFFENRVIDLLTGMGYGGSRRDARESIGKSGDGGIDGIIKEDRLGLDSIYIQAKRRENQVPTKELEILLAHYWQRKPERNFYNHINVSKKRL